jgi:hypothetical protein
MRYRIERNYHPAISSLPVHKPSRNLASRLNDKQAAEALSKLEYWS